MLAGDAPTVGKVAGAADNGCLLVGGGGDTNADEAEGSVEDAVVVGEGLCEAESEIVVATVTVPALNAADHVGRVVKGVGLADGAVETPYL